ncbi:MAG: hypothetical protein L0Z53_06645 [Acidobacteriales bacterium]|nr:hypothetical protein [Terriglobales bacterium]
MTTQYVEWKEARIAKYKKDFVTDLMWLGVPCPACGAGGNAYCKGDDSAPGCTQRKEFWRALGEPNLWSRDAERESESMKFLLEVWRATQ